MSDLADLLKQTDEYYGISVNPFTDHGLNFQLRVFFSLFLKSSSKDDAFFDTLKTVLNILKEKSVELEEDSTFFLRSEDNFMKEQAVDGVYIPKIPFNASIRKDFHDDYKYLNILLMPKSSKIVYIGEVIGEEHFDTIIAPRSEFHFVEDLDEFTSVWKCEAQPFYDDL